MYLMYVDESGDPGTVGSPTRYFVLSAIVVHEVEWQNLLDDLIQLRRDLKVLYGLQMKEEIHASVFVNGRPKLKRPITRNQRISLLKHCLKSLAGRRDISIFSVRCDKSNHGPNSDIFNLTWKYLIQRFDNTLSHRNFPSSLHGLEKGMIICDNTNGKKLTGLLRQMRRYNPIPNMQQFGGGANNIKLRAIVEDPVFRDSKESYIVQMADIVSYFARQFYESNKYIRKRGAKRFYGLLNAVINANVTRRPSTFSIVEL